jgi:hypothetical protein
MPERSGVRLLVKPFTKEVIMSRTHRALTMLVLWVALVGAVATAAVAAPSPFGGVEDQNDRLLRGIESAQAERTQAAVGLARAMERDAAAVPASAVTVAPAAATSAGPALPGRDVDVVATLLFGLVGGLLGGGFAIAGWTAASRRLHRPAAA